MIVLLLIRDFSIKKHESEFQEGERERACDLEEDLFNHMVWAHQIWWGSILLLFLNRCHSFERFVSGSQFLHNFQIWWMRRQKREKV